MLTLLIFSVCTIRSVNRNKILLDSTMSWCQSSLKILDYFDVLFIYWVSFTQIKLHLSFVVYFSKLPTVFLILKWCFLETNYIWKGCVQDSMFSQQLVIRNLRRNWFRAPLLSLYQQT